MIIGLVLSLFLHLSVRAEVVSKGTDWGDWIYDGVKGFSVDVSNYVSSNGIFKISYGEDVLLEKRPQPCHLFRIELRDRAQELW